METPTDVMKEFGGASPRAGCPSLSLRQRGLEGGTVLSIKIVGAPVPGGGGHTGDLGSRAGTGPPRPPTCHGWYTSTVELALVLSFC